jgi:hypothetical protein
MSAVGQWWTFEFNLEQLPEESGAECSLRPYSSPVVSPPIAMAPIVRPRSISVAVVTVVVRLPPASVRTTDPARVLHVGWSGCCYWCDWRCGCGANDQRTTTRSSCDKQLHFAHSFSSLDAPLGYFYPDRCEGGLSTVVCCYSYR